MNEKAEIKIKETAKELKEKFGATAIKADFSSENILSGEIEKLKAIAKEAGLKLYIKIGGCDAYNDINKAKEAGTNGITCPMTETEYSLKKFTDNILKIYSVKEAEEFTLRINIETQTAYKNTDKILNTRQANFIKEIVLGRDDMTDSMNLNRNEINSETILNIAKDIMKKTHEKNKHFILGGEIRPKAINFINELNPDGYETRKIVFEGENAQEKDPEKGIIKAVEFEILWLEYKSIFSGHKSENSKERIKILKQSI